MKPASRPQYYPIKRIVDMVREGSAGGYLPNRGDFLRDEERAPIEYDAKAHGYRLTDETYRLPPLRISRKEAFGFALARKLLSAFEGTPLDMEMRSVLAWMPDVRVLAPKTLRDGIALKLEEGLRRNGENKDMPNQTLHANREQARGR